MAGSCRRPEGWRERDVHWTGAAGGGFGENCRRCRNSTRRGKNLPGFSIAPRAVRRQLHRHESCPSKSVGAESNFTGESSFTGKLKGSNLKLESQFPSFPYSGYALLIRGGTMSRRGSIHFNPGDLRRQELAARPCPPLLVGVGCQDPCPRCIGWLAKFIWLPWEVG